MIPGALVGAIPFAGRDSPYVCIGLMTASFAFNGAITHTVFANIHDLSPNNSASLLAVANSISTTTGFIAPLVATYFTEHNVSSARAVTQSLVWVDGNGDDHLMKLSFSSGVCTEYH